MRRTTKDGADFLCTICGKSYLSMYTLKRHTVINHSDAKRYFVCDSCSKSFTTKPNLIRHITLVHQKCGKTTENPRLLKNIQCALCDNFHGTKLDLLHHYHLNHEIDTSEEQIVFSNFGEFEAWKGKVEEDTISRYIRYNIKRRRDKSIYYYSCHRNGFFKTKGKNIRHLKRMGSNKMNGYCPSRMYATKFVTGEKVVVDFIKTHVGHDMDLRRIPRKNTDPVVKTERKRKSVIAVNCLPLRIEDKLDKPPQDLPLQIDMHIQDAPSPVGLDYTQVTPTIEDSHDVYQETFTNMHETDKNLKDGLIENLVNLNQTASEFKEGTILNVVNIDESTRNVKHGTLLNIVNLSDLPKDIKDGTILGLVNVNDTLKENTFVNLVTLTPVLEIERYKAMLQDKFQTVLSMANSISDCKVIENALLPIMPNLMTMRGSHSAEQHFPTDVVNMKFIIEP